MGLRFRKSFKLAPGVRMNFGASGVSWSLGPRGASVSIGKRGAFLNTGIPGTGLSFRQKIGGASNPQRGARLAARDNSRSVDTLPSQVPMTTVSVTAGVHDDGTVYFQDAQGNPLPDHLVDITKKQQGETIRNLIQQKCDEINQQIEALGEIHLYTPDPRTTPLYELQQFDVLPPNKPVPKQIGFFASLFRRKREKVERANALAEQQYAQDFEKWQAEKERFENEEHQRKAFIEQDIYSEVKAMETFLEENLQSIAWPRETSVSTEILDGGRRIFIDVDLPEIEDMPNKTAAVPTRGLKLSVKDISPTQVQRLYMRHIHGIGFRIIGEVFAALPNAQEVVLSAFSQRPDLATGRVGDEYLYSVSAAREDWTHIQFDSLKNLDVVEALARFELRREMTKTGKFKPIAPFEPKSQ